MTTGIIFGLLVLLILLPAGFLLYLWISNYRPLPVEDLPVSGAGRISAPDKNTLTIMTWNIGYAGLGKEMDFFHEGGKMVRPSEGQFRSYLEGITEFLRSNDSLDFIFLQEVDKKSKRSRFTDEVQMISREMESFSSAFAVNYNVRCVPVPVSEPMGRVLSGIMTLTRYKPENALRIDYGTRFSWPEDLVMLKRCFMVMRFAVAGGRELVLINTHNSVFDKGGKLRKKELALISRYSEEEFNKGNYVVVGGDWNTNPRNFDPEKISSGDLTRTYEPNMEATYFDGWTFASDPSMPSNRDVNAPYVKGESTTTILDFFVVSPNIEVMEVRTENRTFRFSDHQPVFMKFRLL